MGRKKKIPGRLWQILGLPLVLLILLLWFFTGLHNLSSGGAEEGRQQLETALHRAAVAYYAAEGVYPPKLDALVRHSGIVIDEETYAVFYDVFADNLMPDITVLVKET